MTHPNSNAALKTNQRRADRTAAVLECYRLHGPLTDRAVACLLFGENADPNTARTRITEAVKTGLLVEVDSVADSVTRQTVRRCDLAERQQKPFCNHSFAGKLESKPSKKRPGYLAVFCTNHDEPVFYGYKEATQR